MRDFGAQHVILNALARAIMMWPEIIACAFVCLLSDV
jgi:hypothetical protein